VDELDVEADATVCGQMWTFDDLRGSAVDSLRSQCQQVIVLRLSFASGFDSEISFSRLHSLVMFDFDAFAALGAEREQIILHVHREVDAFSRHCRW